MILMTSQKYIWLALIGLAFFVSCSPVKEAPTPILLEGKTMGTSWSAKFYTDQDTIRKESFYKDINALLETVNDQMSTYRPQSELSRFNRHSSSEAFSVSSDTASVIQAAIDLGNKTNGALDVTLGPLINLWGFGPNGRVEQAPSDAEIAAANSFIGLDKIKVSENTLTKSSAQLYVDLSAIAKGFGVDKMAEYLEQKGINAYLVDIGGEMRAKGQKPDGQAWKVAVEKPQAGLARSVHQVVMPGDNAIATSGDYRNYFEQDGVRYSHTIDPVTGKPINHKLASISVIAPTCMEADGLATALNVMGPEKALRFAEQHKIAIYLLIKTEDGFAAKHSTEFAQYLN